MGGKRVFRKKRPGSAEDHGVTQGQGTIKDSDDRQKVDVKSIISRAYKLSESTQEKIQKKKALLDSKLNDELPSESLEKIERKNRKVSRLTAPINPYERDYLVNEKRKKYEIFVRDHPDKVRYWMEYADFEENTMKSIDRCREIYDRACEYHSNKPELIISRGQLEERIGNLIRALEIYQEGSSRFPKESRFYYRIALMKEGLGQFKENPFDEWISRVCPSFDEPVDLSSSEELIARFKSPLNEAVPHHAFENAVDWIIRTQKFNLQRERHLLTWEDTASGSSFDRSNLGSSAQIRLLCQKYVCTYNDSTSWIFYAKIEDEVLKNVKNAILVYLTGMQAIPNEYFRPGISPSHSNIMKLRLLKEFLKFLTKRKQYQEMKDTIADIWGTMRKGMLLSNGFEQGTDYSSLTSLLVNQNVFLTNEEPKDPPFVTDSDFKLEKSEEELYIDVCNLVYRAEEGVNDSEEQSALMARVIEDQIYVHCVQPIERLLKQITRRVLNDWTAAKSESSKVANFQPECFQLVPAIRELMQFITPNEEARNAIIDHVFRLVISSFAVANTRVFQALRRQDRGNTDILIMQAIYFIKEQRDTVEVFFEKTEKEHTNLSSSLCSHFIEMLKKFNEAVAESVSPLKRKGKGVAGTSVLHPAVVYLSNPVWLQKASLESEKDGFRKVMGNAIGKACDIEHFLTAFTKTWEDFCNKHECSKLYFQRLSGICPCRLPDFSAPLNFLFESYLKEEFSRDEDHTRIDKLIESWQDKSLRISSLTHELILKAYKSANISRGECPASQTGILKVQKNILLKLSVDFCLRESQWLPWVFKNATIVPNPRTLGSFIETAKNLSDVTQLFSEESRTFSSLFPLILSETFHAESTPESKKRGSALINHLCQLFDLIEAMDSSASDDICTLCGAGVSIENGTKNAPQKMQFSHLLFDKSKNMKNRMINGDILSPTTDNWLEIFSLFGKISGAESDVLIKKAAEFSAKRIERTIIGLWTCAVIQHCLSRIDPSNSSEWHTEVSTDVFEFVQRYYESHSGKHCSQYMVPRIIDRSLNCLIDEMLVWKQAIFSMLDNLKIGENRTAMNYPYLSWLEFLEVATYGIQFIVLIIGLSSSADSSRATHMRNVFSELPKSPEGAESTDFVTLRDLYQYLPLHPVKITNIDADGKVEQLEGLLSHCVHPFYTISLYLGKAQYLLSPRYDEVLNMYQEMLADITQSYVQLLSSWRIEHVIMWKSQLESRINSASVDTIGPITSSKKKYKLFEIAKGSKVSSES